MPLYKILKQVFIAVHIIEHIVTELCLQVSF